MTEKITKGCHFFLEKIDNLLNKDGGAICYFDGNFAHQYFWAVCHHD